MVFNIKFTLEKRNGFIIKITEKGKTNGQFEKVEGLHNPNFNAWDKTKQMFIEPTEDAIYNNKLLSELMKRMCLYLK